MKEYLGIDVGGTNIKYALMTEDQVLRVSEVPTPQTSLADFVSCLKEIAAQYQDQACAIVMSAPGRIDSQRGYFYTGGALTYIHETDLAKVLAEQIPLPFAAENDAKCAALAELWKGALAGIQNGVVITLGTGIGGAIVIDHHLYRGSTFSAGEFSGISSRLDQPFTDQHVWARINSVRVLLGTYAAMCQDPAMAIDGRQFFAKANAGDATARRALKQYCDSLASGIVSLQTILDAECFCIGGGISRQPILFSTLTKSLDEVFASIPAYFPLRRPSVVPCRFGNDANLIGALYHYQYEMKSASKQR